MQRRSQQKRKPKGQFCKNKRVKGKKTSWSFCYLFIGYISNSSNESMWLCSYCQLSFETASMLNLHTLAHAAENVEEQEAAEADKQQCPQCCQQYGSKRELVEHISAHGKSLLRRRPMNPKKPHKCELCYKSFATDDRLQVIMHYGTCQTFLKLMDLFYLFQVHS
jgi:hypothetical protein